MKSYTKNSLLIVCSLFTVLVACELFLRIGGYKVVTFYPFSGFQQFDEDIEWVQIPEHEATFQGREFKVNVTTNSRGFRDHEYPFKRPVGSKRVVVLGDSFTWGWQITGWLSIPNGARDTAPIPPQLIARNGHT